MPPADGGREAVVVRVVVDCGDCRDSRRLYEEYGVVAKVRCTHCGDTGQRTFSAPLADPVDAARLALGRAAEAYLDAAKAIDDDESCDRALHDNWAVALNKMRGKYAAVRAAREGGGKDGE